MDKESSQWKPRLPTLANRYKHISKSLESTPIILQLATMESDGTRDPAASASKAAM